MTIGVGTEQFWRDVFGRFRPVPTTANPAFVAGAFAKEHWPIPEWLHPQYDLPRDGYYVGIDTPEATQARIDRLRAALAPYFNEPYGDSSPSSDARPVILEGVYDPSEPSSDDDVRRMEQP